MRSSLFDFYKFENGVTERPQVFCYPKINCLKSLQFQQIFLDVQPLGVAGQAAVCHRNPLCIVVPCHRVIGADGSLTGYAEGLDIKEYLLELERF